MKIQATCVQAAFLFPAVAATLLMIGCGDFWQAPNATTPSSTSTTSTTTLSASASSTVQGGSVDLTATVTPSAATGTVTFYDGSTSLGTATLTAGSAALTTSFSTIGTHTLTAGYGGDTTYSASSSSAVTVTVTGASSSATVLAPSTTTPELGATVKLIATVTPNPAVGTVNFFEGTTALGSAPLKDGTAERTASFFGPGLRTLTATFSGNSIYASSTSDGVSVTVGPPGSTLSTTTLTLSSTSIPAGSNELVTATVRPSDATGQITFYDGDSLLGTKPVVSGSSTMPLTVDAAGAHVLHAVFSGDARYAVSTSVRAPLDVY